MPASESSGIAPERLLALYEVSAAINSQHDPDKLLDEIMDQAIALLQAQKGLILFFGDRKGKLSVKVARFMEEGFNMNPESMSRTVISRVAANGKPVLMSRVADLDAEDLGQSMMAHNLKSILCVPLRTRDEALGVIYLDTSLEERFFSEADLNFLEAFANLAGMAIENARSYREIDDLNRNLELKVEKRTEQLREKNLELTRAYEELEEAQLQLVQKEKMAMLGQLAAGVAHEMNSPLGTLNTAADGFSRGSRHIATALDQGDEAGHSKALRVSTSLANMADVTQVACRRISEIVNALGNFTRLDEEEMKTVDINEGINSTLLLLANRYVGRVKFAVELGELPQVRCRAAQINQVFLGLLVFSAESLGEKGNVRITSRAVGQGIEVRVSDDGPGLPREKLAHIFDPAFTTTAGRVGMELGLPLSLKTVRDHGGDLRVDSQPGAGTTFTLSLPLGE